MGRLMTPEYSFQGSSRREVHIALLDSFRDFLLDSGNELSIDKFETVVLTSAGITG